MKTSGKGATSGRGQARSNIFWRELTSRLSQDQPTYPTKTHDPHKYSRNPHLPLLQKKGFELRSSRADTISAQGRARAINLFHIGSTPYYVSNAYATTINIIELQEAERAEGFCLIRLWWVLARNNRRIKQNKTTVVVCSASYKPHKQKKRRLTVVFNLSGSKGIRTPDPLLVRQML